MAGVDPRSSRGTGLNSNRQAHSIHEPEALRLQRDIENITQKLEYERREQLLLDDQIKVLEDEIREVKQKHNDFISNKATESKLSNQYSVLERKLEIAYNQVSDVQAQNRAIREQIDSLRKERVNYKNMIDSLSTDIQAYSTQAQAKHQESRKGVNVDEKQKRQINLLRSKSANERSRFNEKVSQLTSVLKDDREAREETHKKIEESLNQQFKKGNDIVEGTRILKVMLNRWRQKVKDRKKSLDVYIRHVKSLETAFMQMSEATGISSVEEVVTTFIKSEEQKYSVAAYINELTAEIDQIEENNRNTKKAIERCKEISSSGEKRVKEIMADLNAKHERALKKKENRQMQAEDLKETLIKLLQPVKVTPKQKMLEVSREVDLVTAEFDILDSEISEANMIKYLGLIEDFVNKAQIYAAYKNNEKNPASKALLLESLPEKQHSKDMHLKDLLEIKDDTEDPEIDESKVPLKLPYLRERARQLFSKRGMEASSRSMSFRRDVRSVTPH